MMMIVMYECYISYLRFLSSVVCLISGSTLVWLSLIRKVK